MLSLVNEEAADENLDPVAQPEEEDDVYSPDEDLDDGIQFTEQKKVEHEPEKQVTTSFYLDKKGVKKPSVDEQAQPELREQVKEIIKNNEQDD